MCSFNDLGNHPEKESDEVWITRVEPRLANNPQFSTKRVGTPDEDGFLPVFIKRSEFEKDKATVA